MIYIINIIYNMIRGKNINSFATNTEELTKSANLALNTLVQINESIISTNDTVTIDVPVFDEKTNENIVETFSIPSYNSIINKCNNTLSTVNSLLEGTGNVTLSDGTKRDIRVSTIAKSPDTIYDVKKPTVFKSVSNWFFEDMLFPKIVVPFDLKNRIEDNSDRVLVKRLIINNEIDTNRAWFTNNLLDKYLSYTETLTLLNNKGISYWEDEQIVNLPLKVNKYIGSFLINKTVIQDNKLWYYLDNIRYSKNEDDIVNNIELTVGDKLSYNNSSFIITDMVNSEFKITVSPLIGFDIPSPTTSFGYYCEPFSEKKVDIGVSDNELLCVFFKGINEEYNIIGDSWSKGVTINTSELLLENSEMNLHEFYNKYVIDYGIQLEGQAKEKFIPAYYGITPSAPYINSEDFRVVQINTHLNASLSEQNILNTQKQILETKSQIESYKSTIAKQKQDLISKSVETDRAPIAESIRSYTNKLETLSTEYSSLVKSLSALAYENDSVETKPKYRIRGFFGIPEPKLVEELGVYEDIIQFEIAYRYIRLDNSNTSLNTFTFTDANGNKLTGTFSDWIYDFSLSKERVYDNTKGEYVWQTQNIANGEEININQIDIPIQKGERVELKIRSISEAGWPANPLKSEWSNSIIMEFPSNLTSSNLVSDILSQSKNTENEIQLQDTISAAGLYVHIDDSVQSNNLANGIVYKHMASNIGVNIQQINNTSNVLETQTVTLESVISDLIKNKSIIVEVNDKQVLTTTNKLLSLIIKKLNITENEIIN